MEQSKLKNKSRLTNRQMQEDIMVPVFDMLWASIINDRKKGARRRHPDDLFTVLCGTAGFETGPRQGECTSAKLRFMSVCEICQSEYRERSAHQRFCSRECYRKGVEIPVLEPTGKDFLDWAAEFRPEWIEEWRMRRGVL